MWVFTRVYGPIKRELRKDMWGGLGAVKGLWGDPWCIGGDFNVVRFSGERNREGSITGPMRRFSQVIDDLELKDLVLHGGIFMWKEGLGKQRWLDWIDFWFQKSGITSLGELIRAFSRNQHQITVRYYWMGVVGLLEVPCLSSSRTCGLRWRVSTT